VKQKVLWEDKETGATMALVRFPVGVADKIHSHPQANQFCWALGGEWMTPDRVRIGLKDVLFFFPKGERHGATEFTEETTFLFYWDGPPAPKVGE
jgi:hypothetical protein